MDFWHESKRSSGMNIKVELNLRNMLFFSLLINTKISSVRLYMVNINRIGGVMVSVLAVGKVQCQHWERD
jgi:hypothetical protein